MPPLSSVRRNCFYSLFELTDGGGGGGIGEGGWGEYVCQYCVSCKF
jgi:hypothetical protein